MHDMLIKGGRIVDGSGQKAFVGDLAIRSGRVAAVGRELPVAAAKVVDASGCLVTPGFVDVHTHYDGQATWDPLLSPSCWHGVTTVVMGNCGVGFAPVAPGRQRWLIELMEGVEDIPGSALSEGMSWEWESFPEYLDALERRHFSMDLGTQVPHGAVRAYVMGDAGAQNHPADQRAIRQMADLVRESIEAGALGFSTSRTLAHRAMDGEPVPGTFAAEDELFGIGQVLAELDCGLFELAPAGVVGEDLAAPEKEVDWMRRLSARIRRPLTFALVQYDSDPDHWKRILELTSRAAEENAQLRPQVACRPSTVLMGHQTFHPFLHRPGYQELAHLPLEERVSLLAQPQWKKRILSEQSVDEPPMMFLVNTGLHKLFPMGEEPDYEPRPGASVQAIAERERRDPYEVAYDLMLRQQGRELLMLTLFNYSEGNLDAVREMLQHPQSVFGLGDGGAHCGAICDASMTTYMLSHWVRDRRGRKLPLEFAVRKLSREPAMLFGLTDRGLLAPGYKADLNLIDLDGLSLQLPHAVHDLPTGAMRLMQKARGYRGTMVSGVFTMRDGQATGALPGRLLRGPQTAVSATA